MLTPWPSPELFPFESRFVEVAGSRLRYVDEGRAGPTLLFLHPAPASSFMYREFIGALRRDFRCIALDHPGFGLSVPGRGFTPSLDGYAGTVAAFVEALDLRAVTAVLHD